MSSYKTEKDFESLKKEHSFKKNIPKHVIMKKLKNCKKQLLNDQTKTIKDLNIPLDVENSLAVQFPKKNLDTKDPPEVQQRRDDMVNLIQELMDQVEYKKEQIMVVKVKTPAVDLDRDFNSNQKDFMKDEIFNGMKNRLGNGYQFDGIEHQWKDAFEVMMSIVDIERQKSNYQSML